MCCPPASTSTAQFRHNSPGRKPGSAPPFADPIFFCACVFLRLFLCAAPDVDDALHELVLASIQRGDEEAHSLIIPVQALIDSSGARTQEWHPLADGGGSVHVTCVVTPFSLDEEGSQEKLPPYLFAAKTPVVSPAKSNGPTDLFPGGGEGVHREEAQGLPNDSASAAGHGEEDFGAVPKSLRGQGYGAHSVEGHEVLLAAMEDLCEELSMARKAFQSEGREGEALLMGHIHRYPRPGPSSASCIRLVR